MRESRVRALSIVIFGGVVTMDEFVDAPSGLPNATSLPGVTQINATTCS
jgi:hypothetical protein